MAQPFKLFTSTIDSYTPKILSHSKLVYYQCKLGTGAFCGFSNWPGPMHLFRYQFNNLGIPSDHLNLEEMLSISMKMHVPLDFEWYVYTRPESGDWYGNTRFARIPKDG